MGANGEDGAREREGASAFEKAQLAADQKAERERIAKEEQTRKNRALLHKSGAESQAMWAKVEAENKVAEAEWAAGKDEREAAQRAPEAEARSRPTQAATSRPSEPRPQHRLGSPAAGVVCIGRTSSGIGVQPGGGGSVRRIIQSRPPVANSA